jgi:glycosyltransferase involved in cell wall biosynthesis
MHPLFDRHYEIKHPFVVYEHKTHSPIAISGLPRLTNQEKDFGKVISFLGSAECVITSTYHGVYWATLLNRKVVLLNPFSSKFSGFRHMPAVANEKTWKDAGAGAKNYPEALNECRSANLRFREKFREIAGSNRRKSAVPAMQGTASAPKSSVSSAPARLNGPEFGFNVIGFVSANLGQGSAARTTIRLLLENGYRVSIIDIDAQFGRSGHDRSFDHLKRASGDETPYAINLFHLNPPELGAVARAHPEWLDRPGGLNVIVPFWELPMVPKSWIPSLESVDLILAPTHYIEHMMAAQVRNVPVRHYAQTTFLPPDCQPDRTAFGLPDNAVLFITSFEMFSDINRKNTWAVLAAFDRAFSKNDDATLVIKVNNARSLPAFEEEVDRLHAFAARNGRVIVIERVLSPTEVISLYASCDVLVSLHRAEGLGLSPMEAMLLGKPVIATGWSGNMDFMTEQNSCLVPYRLVPVNSNAQSGYKPSYIGGETVWADPDVDYAAAWMQRLASDPGLREKIGNAARTDMLVRQATCRSGGTFKTVRRFYENRRDNVFRMEKFRSMKKSGHGLRVLFQNRSNAFEMPGGDTVVMNRLKEQLERNGATVDFSGDPGSDAVKTYDIVHVFNLTLPACTDPFAKNAVRHNVPFVVTTLQENFPQYYHKATAAYQWFAARAAMASSGQLGQQSLGDAIRAANPVGLTSSPFAAMAANRLFACGRTEAEFLQSVFPRARITVVPFGSSVREIAADRSLFEKAYDVRDFVLVVGRIELRKNQLMLLHALEESTLPVVFADGGFTYQPDYTDLCRSFPRKGRTVFTGRLSDELLVSAYRACRLHCLTSWYELPGLVSLEAARYGCPVVASSWGCLPDYLGETCEWCSPEDPGSIRSAVLKTFEFGKRESAAEAAGRYTWERSGAETLAQYGQVIAEHAGFAPELMALAEQAGRQLSVSSFLGTITERVEKGDLSAALSFYDEHRGAFTEKIPELEKVDALLDILKSKMKKAKP